VEITIYFHTPQWYMFLLLLGGSGPRNVTDVPFFQVMVANCVLALNISIIMTENDLPAVHENVD